VSKWIRYFVFPLIFALLHNFAQASQHGDADRLFDWAESQYSELFTPAGQASMSDTSGEWYYRYYRDSKNYVGVNLSGEVWGAGEAFGEPLYIDSLQALLARIPPPDPTASFSPVSDAAWNETAVRKVMHTFAYGGHAKDEQILLWAEMSPQDAIQEILTFEPSNLKLSPSSTDVLGRKTNGSLQSLSSFWSSQDPENEVPEAFRENYIVKNFYTNDCHAR